MALTVGGPVASAVLTRGIFGKVNRLGEEIAAAGNAARASDDMRALADRIVRADRYATYAPITKAATAIEAAALPAELRMTADIIDKKALPPEAGARIAAEERMADIPTYAKGMGYDLVSGAIGTGTGSLWAKFRSPAPMVDLYALRNQAAGIPRGGFPEFLRGRRMSQDELSEGLSQRAMDAITKQSELDAMRRGVLATPASSAGTPSGGPGPGSPSPAAPSTGGALVPQGSSAPEASAPRLADRVRANQSRIDEALPSPQPSSQPRLPEGHQWDHRMLGSKNRGPDGRVHSMPQDTTAKPKGKKGSDAGRYFPWLNRLAG